MPFPKEFLWGAATASYQVEGYNKNCDWAEAARLGKVPPAGRLADHYNRYEADFDIVVQLGHNAHRFSIEWARIEPREGEWDEEEIAHYRDVLYALQLRNITPIVTLWHFTLPTWFANRGGFEASDSPQIFARYCSKVIAELGDLFKNVSTMNEPNVYATHGYLYGAWPPFKRASIFSLKIGKEDGTSERTGAIIKFSHFFAYQKVSRQLACAHKQAYDAIKTLQPDMQVSVVKHVHYFHANYNWKNIVKARIAAYFQTHVFLKRCRTHLDAIGVNYYRHTKFGDRQNYLLTDMNWKVYPSGLYGALMMLKRYQLPLFVAEAGIADIDDDLRPDYIRVQVAAVERALADQIDVRGHMYWSLMDNYEWALGTKKRFGLVEINYQTLERTVRPSAYTYKAIIQEVSYKPEDKQTEIES